MKKNKKEAYKKEIYTEGRRKMEKENQRWRSRVARLAFLFIFGTAMLCEPALISNATTIDTSSITSSFDNLKSIVTAIISSIGVIITLWGVSEWGIAFQGQDGTMQATAFKRIAGGMVMILAPQIVDLLV